MPISTIRILYYKLLNCYNANDSEAAFIELSINIQILNNCFNFRVKDGQIVKEIIKRLRSGISK